MRVELARELPAEPRSQHGVEDPSDASEAGADQMGDTDALGIVGKLQRQPGGTGCSRNAVRA